MDCSLYKSVNQFYIDLYVSILSNVLLLVIYAKLHIEFTNHHPSDKIHFVIYLHFISNVLPVFELYRGGGKKIHLKISDDSHLYVC